MTPIRITHSSVKERRTRGKEARELTPLNSHIDWTTAPSRPDPVSLLELQNWNREPDLVPIRHGRMLASPFTFYRGAATIMAADLKDTPIAGLGVQLCGDAHLSNFGAFASPERTLLFDLNDFDETLPGPFEYDVKRMAASFAIAGRNNGFSPADVTTTTLRSVSAYREAMSEIRRHAQYGHLVCTADGTGVDGCDQGTHEGGTHQAECNPGETRGRTSEEDHRKSTFT